MASPNLQFLLDPSQLIIQLLRNGLSQHRIAELAQTTQPTISRILSGQIKEPRAKVFVRLCEVLEGTNGARDEVKEERSAESVSSP